MTDKNVVLSPREAWIEERKNQAIEALSVQFSQNALSLEEFERLVEYISRVESEHELAVVDKIVSEATIYAGNPASAPASADNGKSKLALTLFSSREISGDALLAHHRSFLSLFGNTVITIHNGELPPGRTELRVTSVFGNVIIRVPPSLEVNMELMGCLSSAVLQSGPVKPLPGCGKLVITGGAYLSSIAVEVSKEKKRLG